MCNLQANKLRMPKGRFLLFSESVLRLLIINKLFCASEPQKLSLSATADMC